MERDFPFMAVPLCRPFFAIINDPLRADIAQELNVSGLRLGLALIFSVVLSPAPFPSCSDCLLSIPFPRLDFRKVKDVTF